MGLPSTHDNLKGYINAALTRISSNIRNKQYLLVHGTLDDNVHYQQSMMLAKALEHNDVLFQQMVSLSYPFMPFRYKYSRHPVLKHPQSVFSL